MQRLTLSKQHKKYSVGDTISATVGKFKIITSENGKVVKETDWIKNMIMKSSGHGLNVLVRNIIGEAGYDVEITHAKIGKGTTPPTETDTDLETPVNLGISSDPSIIRGDEEVVSINTAHLEFFISDADIPNDTYTEWGLFTGTFGVDEGMFTRALIVPTYSKGTNQDTTIIHEITINN